jgi:putative phosphoribosyl transferase
MVCAMQSGHSRECHPLVEQDISMGQTNANPPPADAHDAASLESRTVSIPVGSVRLEGDLAIPRGAVGVVLFAHGSGSSRHSPRNRFVASELRKAGLATLLMDLLTADEERAEAYTRHLRFNIELLAQRLAAAAHWLAVQRETSGLPVGYFGASTGAAAALVAATQAPNRVAAVVSRGGRPDLAGEALPAVSSPTLLIVGSKDVDVIELNRQALDALRCQKDIKIVQGASHLFEEPGTLEEVAQLACDWFRRHLDLHATTTAQHQETRT